MAYLKAHSRDLFCETDTGEAHLDNFSQLLILQNTGDRSLVTLDHKGPTWGYFIGSPVFAETVYPNDSDTTALAMAVLEDISAEDKEAAMDVILSYLSPDGLPYCWFDKDRPRFCHCICANVFRFFYLNNRSKDLPSVYGYLCSLLQSRGDPGLQDMRDLLILRVRERIGRDKIILGASMRLLSAQMLGITNQEDLETILDAQQLDGGWELSWLWHYGKEPGMIGSRGVVTAMAVNGIQRAWKSSKLRALDSMHCNGTRG
ncbi:hypothetical protein CDD83_314 [Cordyceps sp. RAO-2017]|nr:hypothetical protein CDD83_314 [Cordyceps sp. RAO-2017]